jgi:hypothetical protein
VFEALRALTAADAAATKALEPPKIAEPEQRPPEAIWCVSCARPFPKELAKEHPARKVGEAIAFEPRTSFTKRSRTDLCNWCLDEWEASSEKVLSRSIDIRLVIWRADHPGRYVTDTRPLRSSRTEKALAGVVTCRDTPTRHRNLL